MQDRSRILGAALTAWTPFLAAALVVATVARAPRSILFPPIETGFALFALAALADSITVPLVAGGYVSLAALVQLPVMVLFGPVSSALAGAAGVAAADAIQRRGRLTRIFNLGQRALTVLLAGYAWSAVAAPGESLGAPPTRHGDALAAAVFLSIAVYAASQTLLVNLRLAVVRGERLRYLLTHSGVWQASTSAALGAAGITLALLLSGGLAQNEARALAPLLIGGVATLLLAVRQHAVQEAAAFHAAAGDLLGTLEPGGLLDRLADRVVRIARPDALWIALRAPDGTYAIALARGVTAQQAAPLAAGITPGAADDALSQRRAVAVRDYARDPRRRPDIGRILGGRQVRAALTVPLAAGTEPLGVLTLVKGVPAHVAVGRREVHAWTPEEIELLQAVANEGAVALDNVRLSDATRAQLQRMAALETISERINSEHDVNAVFDLIADSARDVLGADRCGIFLGEPGRAPTHVFSRGLSDEYVAVVAGTVAAGVGAASAVMSRREPVVITDVQHDPLGSPVRLAAAKVGYRTVALFPLLYRDRVTGVLRLYHDRVRPYAQADLALGAAFANQAAIAVENARLLNDAERRARELALLNRVMARVTPALRPEELFETLVGELHATLHYPLVALLTVTDDGTALRVVSRRGYEDDIPTLVPVERGIVGRVARTGVAMLIADVAAERDYLTVDPRVRQEACVPIFVEGRVGGVINVETTEPVLDRSDVELLTALASEISTALRNSVLFAEVQSARDELQALHEAAQTLSVSLELSAVLESLVNVTCRRFGYDRSAILLADDRGGLEVRAACGTGHALGTRTPAWEGAEGQAARNRRPVLVSAPAVEAAVEATLALPLIREGQLVGVFSVGTANPDRLGERARHTLTTLAGYALVAIENARLYEQTRVLASTDGLTGLANHRAFIQELDRELERSKRYALPLSMIMIEVDRFKRYNDTYGHLRGDDVLRMVARTLERGHRKQIDFVARYGGDEFIVLLPHTPRTAAADVAERIRRTIEDTPFIVGRDIASVTVSLGVAAFPEDGDTTITLIDAADHRMYAAKQGGGNAVAAAGPR